MARAMRNEVPREVDRVYDEGDDPRGAMAALQERIAALRAAGQPIPEELRQLERMLALTCVSESQGR